MLLGLKFVYCRLIFPVMGMLMYWKKTLSDWKGVSGCRLSELATRCLSLSWSYEYGILCKSRLHWISLDEFASICTVCAATTGILGSVVVSLSLCIKWHLFWGSRSPLEDNLRSNWHKNSNPNRKVRSVVSNMIKSISNLCPLIYTVTFFSAPSVFICLPWTSEKGALYGTKCFLYVGNNNDIAAVDNKFLVQPVSNIANRELEYNSTDKIGLPPMKGKKYDWLSVLNFSFATYALFCCSKLSLLSWIICQILTA